MLLRFILIFTILIFNCGTDNTQGSIQLITEIDTTIARIGDIINLSVELQNTDNKIIVFPEIEDSESMEIRDRLIVSTKTSVQRANFQVVFWDTGRFVIPEYQIDVLNSDSTLDLTFKTDSVNITIISMLDGVEDKNLRPIKDPVELKNPIKWFRIILIIILILLMLSLFSLWRTRSTNKHLQKIEASEYLSAKDIALSRLNNLENLISKNNKSFYLEASFILREFLENQYYIRALEMTTNDIRNFEQEFKFKQDQFKELIDLLKRADLAKFAKFDFTIQNRRTDFNWIQEFISNEYSENLQ